MRGQSKRQASEKLDAIPSYVAKGASGLRKRTEAAIDALLDLLDTLDGNEDLEPAGDEEDFGRPEGYWRDGSAIDIRVRDDGAEPMLGWSERRAGCGDCPTHDDECEIDSDREPSLGAPEAGLTVPMIGHPAFMPLVSSGAPQRSQLLWADGRTDDREDEHDGCEPQGDDEPDDDHGIVEEDPNPMVGYLGNGRRFA